MAEGADLQAFIFTISDHIEPVAVEHQETIVWRDFKALMPFSSNKIDFRWTSNLFMRTEDAWRLKK